MKVLGIDPGSRVTGYGIVAGQANGAMKHLCDGTIQLDPAEPLASRLNSINRGLNAVIEEFRPQAVAVESVFFSKNARSTILLGHARGVALLSAASNGLEVFEYAPRSVKQAVAGYGNAEKTQVQKMVRMLLKSGCGAKTDAADALAIAICHLSHCRTAPGRGDGAAKFPYGLKIISEC